MYLPRVYVVEALQKRIVLCSAWSVQQSDWSPCHVSIAATDQLSPRHAPEGK